MEPKEPNDGSQEPGTASSEPESRSEVERSSEPESRSEVESPSEPVERSEVESPSEPLPDRTQDETPKGSQHNCLVDAALALLLVMGYVSPLVLAMYAAANGLLGRFTLFQALMWAAPFGVLAVVVWLYRDIRRRGRRMLPIAAEVLVLGILPAWGLVYNHTANASCVVTTCDAETEAFRPLAEPEVWSLLGLHLLVVLAYAVSRRRPAALHGAGEVLVHAMLLVGMVMQTLLAVQFGHWALFGVMFPPLFLPTLAPVLTVILYAAEGIQRLLRRGGEAKMRVLRRAPESVFREAPDQELLPVVPEVHWPLFAKALLSSPVLLGIYAVVHAAWLGRADGALRVFTRTCKYTLSQVPLEIIPQDCHYLCTVAARGHTWLVQPLRVGRRGGKPILVNRQLAVANAFEDLLHTRWPRFGRLARRVYDRVGLPVSRYLRPRWASDLVYLAMKPAEWCFYVALLLLDPDAPEARIDRMYR
ncbi:DUF6688 family protein [Chondromyces apiculatus]|uniref:DUF6688 domain-containing protein n=1 Tax=Chondromyces apiculatus DSM 436 TaxID=1192034 RepID=A0A017TFY0_9BACT|nr:DUF6688 family protein [Chondromyces apiculatus]EYF07730.1 Hypothetical protein CAP_8231 [Chondromyces apiculatus DSM 436]